MPQKQFKKGKISKLKGIWHDIEITAKDIKAARKEIWKRFDTKP